MNGLFEWEILIFLPNLSHFGDECRCSMFQAVL